MLFTQDIHSELFGWKGACDILSCCLLFPKKCCTCLVQRWAFDSQQRWKAARCESGVLILLCSSFQMQKKKSESLNTGSTEKWDEKVFEQNISPKVILVLRNAVFAKQIWRPRQNPTGTMYMERWHGCPACLSACPGAFSTACNLLAWALPPSGTKGSTRSGMPIAAPSAGLPLRTLHRLQHGLDLRQICLFDDHTDHSL